MKHGTTKSQKFEILEDITGANLKFEVSSIRLERLYTIQQKLYWII